MSRHNKFADDSARLSLVIPKYLNDRIIERSRADKCSKSNIVRSCLLAGYYKLYERKMSNEKKQ
jgi:hypothetical protein